MPTFLGATWRTFLTDFVAFVRAPKEPTVRAQFRATAELIYNSLSVAEPRLASYVGAVLEIDPRMEELTELISNDELDPLFTSYQHIADAWGRQLEERFRILADASKVLCSRAEVLRKLSDPNLKPFEAGYGERTTRFPLLVEEITSIDSKSDIRVQLADLLAGTAATSLKASLNKGTGEDREFYEELRLTLNTKQLLVGGIWPYHDLDAMFRELSFDAAHSNQVSGPTYVTQILSGLPGALLEPPPKNC